MKKKMLKFILFFVLVFFVVIHSFYLTHLYSYDEIWIYGFGVNILNGLVPYRDFNMVVGPVFPYLLSIVLGIFGKKLLIYHIVIAIMVVIISYLASKRIGWYSLLIYVALLVYSINGYNTFTLLILFVLLNLLDKNNKYEDIIVAFLVSLMIFTKQSLILLVIPSLIYSKDRKRTLLVYLTMFLVFLVYFLWNDNLFYYLDYCWFGMFDFAGKNGLFSPVVVMMEAIIVLILGSSLVFSRGMRKDIFYVLMYQVMVMPIFDIYHFVLGFSAFLYVVFKSKNITMVVKKTLFIVLIIIEVFLVFTTNSMLTLRYIEYFEHYSEDTFLKGRVVPKVTKDYIHKMDEFIELYPDSELYIFGAYGYLIKLSLDIPINKFDLINNGNMGYHGEIKYIDEIDSKCLKEKCLFIVNESELNCDFYNQTSTEILSYVINNYTKIYSSSVFGVYVN